MFLGCHLVTCSVVFAHVMSTCDVDSLNVHFTFQVWWEGGKNIFCVSDAGKSPTLFPADPPTFTSNKFYCLPNRTVTAAWTTSPVQKVGASEIHEVSVLNSSLRTCDIHNILCAYDLYIYIYTLGIYICVCIIYDGGA